MNRKWMSIAVISAVVTLLAVTCVTATSWSRTPLYTLRMEQQSSQMNFLPTEMNTFTYVTEKGCNLNCSIVGGCCGVIPLSTSPASTCNPSCFETCDQTCPWTCFDTCESTCDGFTCDETSCQPTCSTCDQPTCPDTCWVTCDGPTCPGTCGPTCDETCIGHTCTRTC